MPSGLLPTRASLPPVGAMVVLELLPMMLAKPASGGHLAIRTDGAEMVAVARERGADAAGPRARSIAASSARMPTTGPKALAPSTRARRETGAPRAPWRAHRALRRGRAHSRTRAGSRRGCGARRGPHHQDACDIRGVAAPRLPTAGPRAWRAR
jgi:hypothetical protein